MISVPGEDDFYRNNIDKKDWGLTPAAKVENYRGFYFATLDPEAPPLEEYLGWVGKVQQKNDPNGIDVRIEPKFTIPDGEPYTGETRQCTIDILFY